MRQFCEKHIYQKHLLIIYKIIQLSTVIIDYRFINRHYKLLLIINITNINNKQLSACK